MPDSSNTSRRAASSIVSPGSMKPASAEYMPAIHEDRRAPVIEPEEDCGDRIADRLMRDCAAIERDLVAIEPDQSRAGIGAPRREPFEVAAMVGLAVERGAGKTKQFRRHPLPLAQN